MGGLPGWGRRRALEVRKYLAVAEAGAGSARLPAALPGPEHWTARQCLSEVHDLVAVLARWRSGRPQ